MLNQRLEDLEREKEYARYQLEERVRHTWRPRTIYACPREWFRHLVTKVIGPVEHKRFKRVHTTEAHMVMITPHVIGMVVQ